MTPHQLAAKERLAQEQAAAREAGLRAARDFRRRMDEAWREAEWPQDREPLVSKC